MNTCRFNYDHFKHALHFMCLPPPKEGGFSPASHNLHEAKTLKVAKGLVTVTWHRWNSNLEKIFRWRNQGWLLVKKLLLIGGSSFSPIWINIYAQVSIWSIFAPQKSGWNFPKNIWNRHPPRFNNHESPRSKRDEFLMTSHYNHPRSHGYSDGEKAAFSQHFDHGIMVN